MKSSNELCQEAPGLGGEGKTLTHGSEEEEPQQSSAPQHQVALGKETPLPSTASGVKQLSESPGEGAVADTRRACLDPSLEEPHLDRSLRKPRPQGKMLGRKLHSPATGKQKRPPEVSCPVQKKKRTLYRPDQLEKLERLFQKDHYPDSEQRQEISQAVGVTPQRIMVWFQNRRAKWRRGENLNGAKNKDSPADPGPRDSQPSCVAEAPSTMLVDPEPRTLPQEPPLDVLPEPPLLLTSDQMLAPTQQSKGAPGAALTPPLFSPPPVRRAKRPFPLGPLPPPQAMPVQLDAPGIDTLHVDRAGGSWGTSFAPPPACSYLEALESQDYQPSNQLGPFQFPLAPQTQLLPPPQPQFSYLHPFSLPPALAPPLPEELLFMAPHGSGGSTAQGYFPDPSTGQLLFQPPTKSPGAVPWSDPCLPELSFPGPFCPPSLGQPLAGDSSFQELFQAPYTPYLSQQTSPGLLQLPEGARPGCGPPISKAPEGWPGLLKEQPQALEEVPQEDKSHGL